MLDKNNTVDYVTEHANTCSTTPLCVWLDTFTRAAWQVYVCSLRGNRVQLYKVECVT